jgi:hypothetical protein
MHQNVFMIESMRFYTPSGVLAPTVSKAAEQRAQEAEQRAHMAESELQPLLAEVAQLRTTTEKS